MHLKVTADLALSASALRVAALVVHDNSDGRHVHIALQKAADELGTTKSTVQYGRDQLIARK